MFMVNYQNEMLLAHKAPVNTYLLVLLVYIVIMYSSDKYYLDLVEINQYSIDILMG